MRYKLLILVCIMVLLVGCAGVQDRDDDKPVDVYSGTQALTIEFRPDMPYSPVSRGEDVDVGVEIKNFGRKSVNGLIIVEGVTPAVNSQNFDVDGKEITQTSYGGPEYITFENIPINFRTSLIVTSCYPYSTSLVDSFCYDPELGGDFRTKTCEFVRVNSLKNGQGAPVAVSTVTIDRKDGGKTARLRFDVENLGGGFVRHPGNALDDCQGKVDPDFVNKVRVDKVMFSNQQATCVPAIGDVISLENNKASFTCEVPGMGDQASMRNLEVELSYGYVTQSSIKQVEIQT